VQNSLERLRPLPLPRLRLVATDTENFHHAGFPKPVAKTSATLVPCFGVS
jgi:hypothetical protein